ncbi:MAG: hypothetical protein JOZ72_09040 [Alphaproteobacteria bacterium]|nr:hypothetical protein [Alphaproteobacteria bacterium]
MTPRFASAFAALLMLAAAPAARAQVAVDDSVLLDPFDPVPEIQFRHFGGDGCWDGCGYGYDHDGCRDGCSRHHRCGRDCEARWHCDRDCREARERREERYAHDHHTFRRDHRTFRHDDERFREDADFYEHQADEYERRYGGHDGHDDRDGRDRDHHWQWKDRHDADWGRDGPPPQSGHDSSYGPPQDDYQPGPNGYGPDEFDAPDDGYYDDNLDDGYDGPSPYDQPPPSRAVPTTPAAH